MFFSYTPKIGRWKWSNLDLRRFFHEWMAKTYTGLYQPVNYKLTEPLNAFSKTYSSYVPSNTSEKNIPGNHGCFWIIFQLSKLSNFDVEVTSCDTWGVVNLGSITFGSYPPKKTQDARIPKSPAEFPNRFLGVGKRANLHLPPTTRSPFFVDPKMVASQKTWWAPGRKHPPNRKS